MEKIANQADAAKLKQLAITRQQWANDRSFKNAIARKSEKGFTSLKDYEQKRAKYLSALIARRKELDSTVSERSNKKYELIGAYKRLKPALYIVAFIFAVWYTVSHRFFMPEPTEHYFTLAKPTAVAATNAPRVVVSAAPAAISSSPDIRSLIVTIALGLAILFFVLYFVSRRAKRRKAQQVAPIETPDTSAE